MRYNKLGFTPLWTTRAKKNSMSQTGFTLPELLLASLILVFVLAGILSVFVNCGFLNESNRNLAVAISHAQYIMEEIRGTSFSQIESKVNNGDWDLSAAEIQSAPYNLTALSNEYINTNITQSGNPLGVSVTDTWTDRGGRSRSINLETLITNY